MADLKISALNSLAGADLVAADVVAVVDNSASETKKLTVSDLIANGVTLISNSTIPSAKILFSAGSIDTAELAASAVETAKINDSAVTAAKLADNSSVTLVSTLPASGDFIGQIALDTDDNSIVVWNGSAWLSPLASGSVNVVNGSTSGVVNITTSSSAGTVTVSATLDDTTAAKQFLAGPTGAGGTVGYRAIASGDLPTATSSAKGAVAVNGNGLTMSNDEIQIDNSVTAETTEHHLVQYDANGLITAGRVIAASDLPEATSSAKGAVVPGSGLSAASGGTLNHSNSTTPGTFTKVTVDAQGHVTSAVTLVAADIPDLDAAKITTGTFPTARLADDAVTAAKLADQSVAKFGGAGATDNVVTFPDGDFKGQFFFDEKNEDLYIYTGESFLPITVISGNLVNAGTYNANTNLLTSVTTAGSAAGFTNGAALPQPATGNLNYYVVVDTSGTGSGNAPAVALAPPDMLISLGTGSTFQLIDVSNAIAGQTAANISVVSTGNIAATDVQAALQELDTEKLAKAGGTMTGNLELGAGIVIVFEGATDDGFETTLTVTDPTADRTLTLPNESGTLLTTGSSGAVTSAMIADGTIVNADISASAEIAVSKLANGTARQLLQTDTAGTGVEFTSNVDVPGTLDVTGAATFDSTAAVTGALTVTGVINADGKVKFPAGTANAPSFYNGTDTDTGLYFSAANEISVATGGIQRVVVDSSGNVGINATTPASLLDLNTGASGSTAAGFVTNPKLGIGGDIFFEPGSGNDVEIFNYRSTGMAFGTSGAEKMRIDGSGRLLLGTSTARATGGSQNRYLQVEGTTYATAGLSLTCNSTTNAPTLNFGRSRGTSIGSSAAVQDGDDLGFLTWSAADGTDLVSYAAGINAEIDGTPGSNDTPGRLIFQTTADGNEGLTERMRIDSSGNVGIGANAPGLISGMTRYLTLAATGSGQAVGLELAGNRTGGNQTSSRISFVNNTSEIAKINCSYQGSTTTGSLEFHTSGSQKAVIDSSGNLGIGTSGPTSYANSQTTLVIEDDTNPAICWSDTGQTRDWWAIASGSALSFKYADGGGSSSATNITNVLQLDNSGNVGIGTTTPGTKLHVQGDNNLNVCILDAQGTAPNYILDVRDDGTSKFRVDGSGQVGIGTASPVRNLHINGADSDTVQVHLTNSTTGGGANDGFSLVLGSDESGILNMRESNPMRFFTSDTERMRIDSSGRLLLGASSSVAPNRLFQIAGSNMSICANTANTDGVTVDYIKSRNTSYGSNTIVQSGDTIAKIQFRGDDGSDYLSQAAQIAAEVDGTPGSNDMPGRLVFSTTADGASTPTERMRIASNGVVTVKNSSVGEIDALTSASTITPDFAASNNFSVTLGTNATLANPSNLTAGQSGVIAITQDSTGSRTLAYGSKFKFAGGTAPTLTTTASAVDILTYYVESTSRITAQVLLNVS